MENINDRIEQEVLLQFDQQEHKKLLSKYQDRTSVQAFENFVKGIKHTRTILQSLSFILGFGFALMMSIKMPSISFFIFSLCLVLLFLIEYSKRWTLDKFFEIGIVNNEKLFKIDTKILKTAIVFLISVSASISFIGSPYVVEYFAKHEPLINLKVVASVQDSLIKQDTMVFHHKKRTAAAETKNFLINNGRKNKETGEWTIRSRGASTLSELKENELLIDKQINPVLLQGIERKNKELEKAKEKNAVILQDFKNWCYQFGFYGSVSAIFIDFIIIILSSIISKHEERKLKENNSRLQILDSLKEMTPKEQEQRTFKEKRKKEESVFQEVKEQEKELHPIGFGKKEGAILVENDKEYILLEMKKGKNKGMLKKKTKSELKNLINNQSNLERIEYLTGLLNNFSK